MYVCERVYIYIYTYIYIYIQVLFPYRLLQNTEYHSVCCTVGPWYLLYIYIYPLFRGPSLVAQLVKNPPAMQETLVRFLGQEDPLEKGKTTHSSILGFPWWLSWWRICLQCGRPGFDPWVRKILWRREQLPTPVFWPGVFHGLQSMGSQRVGHDWVAFTFLFLDYFPI